MFWTLKEDKILEKYYPIGGVTKCLEFIDRPKGAIYNRANRLKIFYCGRNHNHIDLTGKEFGRLKVISISHKNRQIYWKCICKCGNETKVRCDSLLGGETLSCGCLGLENSYSANYKGGKHITGQEFATIRTHAKDRNLEFNITVSDIEEIFEKQDKKCKFSGAILCFNSNRKSGNGKIICGDASIDRIDSAIGYTKDNIQIIHKDINFAKRSKSDKDFIEMCCKIADYSRSKYQAPGAV